jgi:serine/threonine-protein kinase
VAERLAVRQIHDAGLKELIIREPDDEVKLGIVIDQDPQPGDRTDRGNFVTIRVSTGKPKTRVPNVVGKSRDEAVADLVEAKLKANVVAVNSLKPVNEVLAQAPKPGTELIQNATVRINVSKGPRPVAVPNVVGSAFESAESTLQGIGFGVAREDVEDDAAAGIVVGQNPAAGTQQSKGSTITLQVSKGPATSQVPDVTSLEEGDAQAQLEESGFEVQVVEEIVDDETLDGRVLSQDPEGGSDAKQGTAVVIVVGRFQAPAETTPAPP